MLQYKGKTKAVRGVRGEARVRKPLRTILKTNGTEGGLQDCLVLFL